MRLERTFYTRNDVVEIARELIGKVLYTKIENEVTAGIILETEAYCGRNDKACHANNNRRTKRTEVMYQEGGRAYIYLCYGIHHLFNVVTNKEGLADAVLIRAIKPIIGYDLMARRRNTNRNLSDGPGKLSKALGLSLTLDGTDLLGDRVWIEDHLVTFNSKKIEHSKRIGVEYAGEDAKKEWRFFINAEEF